MYLSIPKSRKLLNIGNFPGYTTVSEISVPPEDDIAWCIVLSYIISRDCKSCEDLSSCLEVLTGNTIKEKNIGQSIKSFNPFRDNYSFFGIKSIKNVIRDFKTNLGWDNLTHSWAKINAASVMLNCQIWVIYNDDTFDRTPVTSDKVILLFISNYQENIEHRARYSFAMGGNKKKEAALAHCMRKNKMSKKNISKLKSVIKSDENFLISLLRNNCGEIMMDLLSSYDISSKLRELGYETDPRCEDSNGFSAFYYAMKSCDSDICFNLFLFGMKFLELRFHSLKSYREPNPEIHRYLNEVKNILLNDQRISKSFELSKNRETIEILFYSMLRLIDFLIAVNPNKSDSSIQNSAENGPPEKERDRILLILEKYSEFFNSLISNDKEIDLRNVSEYIKCKTYCDSIDLLTSLFFFDSIYNLKKLLSLSFEVKLFIHSSNEKLVLQDLRDKICEIFNVKEPSEHSIYSSEELELICEDLYDEYCGTRTRCPIDATRAFGRGGKYIEAVKVFWEKTKKQNEPSELSTHSSKKELKLTFGDMYATTESEFFILVLSCVIFKKIEKSNILKKLYSYSDENLKVLYEIPLKIRRNIQERTQVFHEILDEIAIKRHVRKKGVVPIEEFHSLLDLYPCIRDYLNVERLKNYLNIPKKFRHFTKTSIFATERILQVLGEFITLKPGKQFCVSWFLSLYIPQNVGEILKNLRFRLSKFDPQTFWTKFNIEKRIDCRTYWFHSSKSKHFCFTFEEVGKEINNINNYLKPFFSICDLRISAYIIENLKDILSKMNLPSEQSLVDQVIRHLLKNVPVASFKKYYSDIHAVFRVLLNRIDLENNVSVIEKMIEPLILITEWVKTVQKTEDQRLLESSKFCEIFYDKNKEDAVTDFLKKCRDFITVEPSVPFMQLEPIDYIQIFLERLDQSSPLNQITCYFEKNAVQNAIPEHVLEFKWKKEAIIKGVEEGFSLEKSLREKTNIAESGRNLLHKYFKSKDAKVTLNLLKTSDPIQELEKAFKTDSATFTMCNKICKVMQFEDEIKAKFSKVCRLGYTNTGVNKLSLLDNRIQLIKNILTEQNREISSLWNHDNEEKQSQQYYKIIHCFLDNFEFLASIEMLFYDCMEIFGINDYWLKSEKMYGGICMRNVIAHGNVLLENLGKLLDPTDLTSEIINKCIELIQDEDCVKGVLKLYSYTGKNISKLEAVINSNETDEHDDDRKKIVSRYDNDGKNRYIELLRPSEGSKIRQAGHVPRTPLEQVSIVRLFKLPIQMEEEEQ